MYCCWTPTCGERIALCNFMDSAQVIVYSNVGQIGIQDWLSHHGKVIDSIPKIIAIYRTNVGSVDQFNKATNKFSTKRGSKKWWKPIFFWLLDAAIVNAWVLYKIEHEVTQICDRGFSHSELVGEVALCDRMYTKEVNSPLVLRRITVWSNTTTRNIVCEGRP